MLLILPVSLFVWGTWTGISNDLDGMLDQQGFISLGMQQMFLTVTTDFQFFSNRASFSLRTIHTGQTPYYRPAGPFGPRCTTRR